MALGPGPGEPANPVAADPTPVADTGTTGLLAVLRTARPRQWSKNVLVFAAPLAAGVLDETDKLVATLVAFVAFCIAASATYFLNDALDIHADRQHPVKRFRPVAAGHLDERHAYLYAVLLGIIALAIAAPLNNGLLTAVLATYLAIQGFYSVWLRHEPVLDLAAVSSGFVLHAIAGGVATDVHISDWFLIVAGGASLFMVTGKRHTEQVELGTVSHHHRRTLAEYSTAFLAHVRTMASSVTIGAYCLWAFENAAHSGNVTLFRFSIIPFVLGMLRYSLLIERGHGGTPEEVVLSDRELQLFGVCWAVLFALGVYVA